MIILYRESGVHQHSASVFLFWESTISYRRCVSSLFLDNTSRKITRHSLWYEDKLYDGAPSISVTLPTSNSDPVAAQIKDFFYSRSKSDLVNVSNFYATAADAVLWKTTSNSLKAFDGKEIEEFCLEMLGLFQQTGGGLTDITYTAAQTFDTPRVLFVSWTCVSRGIRSATETLVFDDDRKIIRHIFAFCDSAVSTAASMSATETTGEGEDVNMAVKAGINNTQPPEKPKFETHSGMLQKRGHIRTNWSQRFFILHPYINIGGSGQRQSSISDISGSSTNITDNLLGQERNYCLYYFRNEPRVGTNLTLLTDHDERPRGVIPLKNASITSDIKGTKDSEFVVTTADGVPYPIRATSKYARDLWISKIQDAISLAYSV